MGTTRRLRAVGTDDAVSSVTGTDDAFGSAVASGATVDSAVASGAAVGLASKAARGLGCSPRNFPTLAVLDVVEGGSVSTAFGPGAADATAAGEVIARAAGRFELRAEAGPGVLCAVESVADGRDDFEEPSSAQAIPHVVTIAAPTPRATASPPTRPMHLEALIVDVTGSREVLQGPSCAESPLLTIFGVSHSTLAGCMN